VFAFMVASEGGEVPEVRGRGLTGVSDW
jgi:thymidine phosphorylase